MITISNIELKRVENEQWSTDSLRFSSEDYVAAPRLPARKLHYSCSALVQDKDTKDDLETLFVNNYGKNITLYIDDRNCDPSERTVYYFGAGRFATVDDATTEENYFDCEGRNQLTGVLESLRFTEHNVSLETKLPNVYPLVPPTTAEKVCYDVELDFTGILYVDTTS